MYIFWPQTQLSKTKEVTLPFQYFWRGLYVWILVCRCVRVHMWVCGLRVCGVYLRKMTPADTHMVVRCTEEVPAQVGVPGQAVALLLVTPQPKVGATVATGVYWGPEGTDGKLLPHHARRQRHNQNAAQQDGRGQTPRPFRERLQPKLPVADTGPKRSLGKYANATS